MGEVFPAGGVNALAGLHSPQTAHPRSPAKRGASRGETASIYKSRGIPGLRRKRLTRATARRPHNPVARLSAARAGEKPRRYMNPGVSPGCGVNALAGLHSPQTAQPRSPAKRGASRGEAASSHESLSIPGLRRKRLTRATARRPHNPVARLSAARAGGKPRRYIYPGVSPGCGVNALPGLPPADRTTP